MSQEDLPRSVLVLLKLKVNIASKKGQSALVRMGLFVWCGQTAAQPASLLPQRPRTHGSPQPGGKENGRACLRGRVARTSSPGLDEAAQACGQEAGGRTRVPTGPKPWVTGTEPLKNRGEAELQTPFTPRGGNIASLLGTLVSLLPFLLFPDVVRGGTRLCRQTSVSPR